MDICLKKEGNIEKSLVMWCIDNCEDHLKSKEVKNIFTPHETIEIKSFIRWCNKEQNFDVTDYLWDLSEIKDSIAKFIDAPETENTVVDNALSNLEEALLRSAFQKPFDKADFDLETILYGMLTYIDSNAKAKLKDRSAAYSVNNIRKACETILSGAAEFQRSNDKWSEEKQQHYIHNLLMGYSDTVITLYFLKGKNKYNSSKILDGLQRISAIIRAFTDPSFMIPTKHVGDKFSQGDYISSFEMLYSGSFSAFITNARISIKVYEFESDIDAVDFYIAQNKGSTHSEKDIRIAFEYKAKLLQKN